MAWKRRCTNGSGQPRQFLSPPIGDGDGIGVGRPRIPVRRPLLIALALCAACADLSRDDQGGAPTALPDDETDTEGNDDGGMDSIRLDVAGGMGTGGDDPGGDKGCRGIDFLFVVDNSGSMQDEQENLASSFPGFVDAMQEKVAELEAGDFHIMVTDTDAIPIRNPGAYCGLSCDDVQDFCYADNGSDLVPCAFSQESGCMLKCREDLNDSCDAGSCKELLGCDECGCNLGAGLLDDLESAPCGVAGGKRYIQDGQPNLHETFSCLAQVGTDGDGDERIAQATVTALSPEMLGNAGCNSGFVRDDAILVVTLITDEEDSFHGEGSAGDPPDWYDAVLASKNGDEEAIVMLDLLGDYGQPGAVCNDEGNGNGEYPPRLHEFIESFPRHVTGSVCEPNYAGFFEQAVDLIKDTCEVYVPPQG